MLRLVCALALLQLAPGTTLRRTPPGERDVTKAITRSAGHAHNYRNVGLTRAAEPGARIVAQPLPRLPSRRFALSIELGHGRCVYDRAVCALRELRMHHLSPSRGIATLVTRPRPRLLAGAGLVTWARSSTGLYALNACRIVYDEQTKCSTTVAYGTLVGHWIAGEEAMAVRIDRDGLVTFSLLSISRGSGFGVILFPFLFSMQRGFFVEQLTVMRRLARHGHSGRRR
ncbi:hypothetical protein T492DRAFT_59166 [Pavlovales sp. CCMP2436]|nr:hypothetical protein T492DRAFT_59166 [Pavlovales sp. CCMP2436]